MAEDERLKAWLEAGHALIKDGLISDFYVVFKGLTVALGNPRLGQLDDIPDAVTAPLAFTRDRDA